MNDLFSIKKTKKNAALFRKMSDEEDFQGAMKARQAFAAFIREPIQDVIEAFPALQSLFTARYECEYGQPATIPLTPLWDIRDAGLFKVWAQSRPGTLATSRIEDVSEMPVGLYELQSAVAFPLSFVRAARVDVIAAYLDHVSQNFLRKIESNSASVISAMLAQTTYKLRGTDTYQVYRTATQGTIIPQDINALNRIMARVNVANIGGTPANASRAITTLVGSPEFVEAIRNTAFQALNTNNTNGALGGPDAYRQEVYSAGGNLSWMGAEILSLNDLGVNQPYNILFGAAAGSTAYAGYAGAGTRVFSPGSEQVVYAINKNVKAFAKITEVNPDTGASMKVLTDNQFSNRDEQIGFYLKMREGRAGLDGRGAVTLVF